jgi:DNA-binding CsgD family transcriptional regulator
MLGQGKSMTAISESLGIAYKTVANICTQMKVKLGVDRTADLIRLAIETLRT